MAAVVLGLTGVALLASPANAAFPGSDGSVVFSAASGFFSRGCGGPFGTQLYTTSLGPSRPVQLTCTRGLALHPFVSPDGSQVVFTVIGRSGVSQLYTLPLTAATQHPRPSPTLVSDGPDDDDDDASWSPANDGTIVFARTAPGAMTQLYVENVSDPQAASPLFSSPTGFDDTQPVYDPADPGVIVFVRRMGGADHIMLVDVATGTTTDLSAQAGTPASDDQPDFAPTGNPPRLVFQSTGTCGRAQLFTMALDGSDRMPVFSSSTAGNRCPDEGTDPAYAPQGDAIVFDGQGRWGDQLYTVAVDGSGSATGPAQAVTHGVFLAGGPSWAPVDAPPTETPEAPWAVALPMAGVGTGGAVVALRRRRIRSARPPG